MHSMNHCKFITFTDATAIDAATLSSIGTFQAPLPYAFDALEPFISSTLLKEHFTLYHQPHAAALESPLTPQQSIVESLATHLNWINRRLLNLRTATQHSGGARMLAIRLCNIRDLVREHGGGHVNHSLFWKWITPPGSSPGAPVGALASLIESTFGSFINFKITFTRAALSIPADGWAWLIMRADRTLAITAVVTREPPSSHRDFQNRAQRP
jgi:Fe-Mn family superoxide dismutase